MLVPQQSALATGARAPAMASGNAAAAFAGRKPEPKHWRGDRDAR
jgi:hypothetical protein